MQYISKQHLLALVLCFGVFLALGTAGAYTAPTAGPTGNNSSEPILENAVSQDKPGNLSVNAFTARTNSAFLQDVTFNGIVSGGTPSDTNSTLRFGDNSHITSLSIAGSLRTNKTFKSESLAHSGPGLKPLCADAEGNLFLCAGSTPQPVANVSCLESYSNGTSTCDTGVNGTWGSDTSFTYQTAGNVPTSKAITVFYTEGGGGQPQLYQKTIGVGETSVSLRDTDCPAPGYTETFVRAEDSDGTNIPMCSGGNPISFNWLSVTTTADQDWYYAVCDVGLNQVAPTDATIGLRYTYTTAGELPPIYHVRECYVGVPTGNTSYQQQDAALSGYLYPSQIENNLCYIPGSNNYPVTANVPAC